MKTKMMTVACLLGFASVAQAYEFGDSTYLPPSKEKSTLTRAEVIKQIDPTQMSSIDSTVITNPVTLDPNLSRQSVIANMSNYELIETGDSTVLPRWVKKPTDSGFAASKKMSPGS